KIRAEFIEGMGKIDDKLMVLLDVNHVLSIDELSKIKSIGDELNASSVSHAGIGEETSKTETLKGKSQ
ncbi:MAG: hypothetical protein GY935_16805, partial [Gammaproteobacteria bacterium]|nr:hypothetical protein [Gammaproteobacteria bacterium]